MALRFAGAAVGGGLGGLFVAIAMTGSSWGSVLRWEFAVPFVATILVVTALVATGRVRLGPLWHTPQREQREVAWAVMRGRAVRSPELAGLAVAAAADQRRRWKLSVVSVLGVLSFFLVVVSTGAPAIVYVMSSPMLVISLLPLVGALNAARAEAANRALLERS